MSGPATAQWRALGTTITVVVDDPGALGEAVAYARDLIGDVDAAASRFRDDSELSRLNRLAAGGAVDQQVSPILGALIQAALRGAQLSDGICDPTVGHAVLAAGYDDDIAVVTSRDPAIPATPRHISPGWASVGYDAATHRLRLPPDTCLDLGATAKAAAADMIATAVARRLGVGVVASLGGDVACAGRVPDGGWPIAVADGAGTVLQTVRPGGQALATSSTQKRAWRTAVGMAHHIIDPRTGLPAEVVWSQVTCVAADAVQANAASTAAIVLGRAAPAWLERRGIVARLDGIDGRVVATRGWPTPSPAGTAPGVGSVQLACTARPRLRTTTLRASSTHSTQLARPVHQSQSALPSDVVENASFKTGMTTTATCRIVDSTMAHHSSGLEKGRWNALR